MGSVCLCQAWCHQTRCWKTPCRYLVEQAGPSFSMEDLAHAPEAHEMASLMSRILPKRGRNKRSRGRVLYLLRCRKQSRGGSAR